MTRVYVCRKVLSVVAIVVVAVGCGGSGGGTSSSGTISPQDRAAARADLKSFALAEEFHRTKTGSYTDSMNDLTEILKDTSLFRLVRANASSWCASVTIHGRTWYASDENTNAKTTSCA